jgi:hypothetical protein
MPATAPFATPLCSYEIDAAGDLVMVDDRWCRFAVDNGAPEYADRATLYGRRLLSFISEPTTRLIYSALIARVTATGVPVRVPLRCDAPAFRRWLELEMTPRGDGGICFTSRQTRGEPRQSPIHVDAGAPSAVAMIHMCSWCNDIDTPRGWIRAEDAVAVLELFGGTSVRAITHGICPACISRFDL